ncbi:MAG: hypothetical protein AMJ72_12095 [Acidithiobacillales bacterium SM1_46]|nr:MAG: hypothetical protein AMJ72_12095 [Acidithiobacillales bacterium SM1_46]
MSESNLPTAPARERFWLIASTEGQLLFAGLSLAGLLALALGIGWHLFPDRILGYLVMTSLTFFIGPATGMTFGYASGFTHTQVVPLNMLVETIQVLIVYPLFALSWRQLIEVRRLQPYVARMHVAAESHTGMVRKFGIAGLFVFVFVPFWMTGPVVGSIIGFLIGLRPWVNVVVVLLATYIATGIWALLLNELSAWAATFNRLAPYALVIAIALIVVAGNLWHRRRRRAASDKRI